MRFKKEKFKKIFPHLAAELEQGSMRHSISSVRTDAEVGESAASRRFVGYNPDIVDFIRRCDTEEQALEIIEYMERRGEITSEYADGLRRQLKEKGLRSFGSKKMPDYYFKYGGYG